MGTRALYLKKERGRYIGVYSAYNNYPNRALPILQRNYATETAVDELVHGIGRAIRTLKEDVREIETFSPYYDGEHWWEGTLHFRDERALWDGIERLALDHVYVYDGEWRMLF